MILPISYTILAETIAFLKEVKTLNTGDTRGSLFKPFNFPLRKILLLGISYKVFFQSRLASRLISLHNVPVRLLFENLKRLGFHVRAEIEFTFV